MVKSASIEVITNIERLYVNKIYCNLHSSQKAAVQQGTMTASRRTSSQSVHIISLGGGARSGGGAGRTFSGSILSIRKYALL